MSQPVGLPWRAPDRHPFEALRHDLPNARKPCSPSRHRRAFAPHLGCTLARTHAARARARWPARPRARACWPGRLGDDGEDLCQDLQWAGARAVRPVHHQVASRRTGAAARTGGRATAAKPCETPPARCATARPRHAELLVLSHTLVSSRPLPDALRARSASATAAKPLPGATAARRTQCSAARQKGATRRGAADSCHRALQGSCKWRRRSVCKRASGNPTLD